MQPLSWNIPAVSPVIIDTYTNLVAEQHLVHSKEKEKICPLRNARLYCYMVYQFVHCAAAFAYSVRVAHTKSRM
jgi:hypothetical protein